MRTTLRLHRLFRPAVAHLATLAVLAALGLPLLGGCSLAGGAKNAAATASASPSKSATPTGSYVPMAGPIEAASALPKECSEILTTAQLQAVFGAGFPIGEDYGSYAALAGIGRTGRVACVFGVGLDSFGKQSAGTVEVAIATYTSAAVAVGRAADTVQTDSQAGATEAPVSVGGHPATIVVEQTAVGATTSPAGTAGTAGATSSAGAAATASSAAASSAAPSSASGAPTASASGVASSSANGETELVMADGNRTFVLQIPLGKLSAERAVTVLTQLTLEVYQNTIPQASPASSKA
ncbi:hypothetical protein KDK95_23750 [Actinospica sp. MGRD01-02]|uniref:DUF3558 domain-containing protein n=1 Tax=Actinospica acidithermotolerans TaxID=2828514 RepID=A0A941EDC3_9ACTN|nr:hypothetical protein [Actinospica acidithermotolerans]MBR7829341.1 hypothetical protein [Actinospica acidithermotolerans]